MRKAALIEIYGSHSECLYSQLLFLKMGGYHTTLLCSENLRQYVEGLDNVDKEVFFDTSKISTWKLIWAIRNYIIQNKIDTVIFNTAHGRTVRNLCMLPFPSAITFAGTLHGINKLKGSLTQKLISLRIKKYFLLNHVIENVQVHANKGLRFEAYYPIFHPHYEYTLPTKKAPDEIWIAIPGYVEYKRRDYETLVKTLAGMQQIPNCRFLILGNGEHLHGNGKELKILIQKEGLEQYFMFWDGYMDNPPFHEFLKKCDVVMPLIHPINNDMKKYLNDQISGSYNLGFAYKKPLLMHSYFQKYEDFRDTSFFYDLDTMATVLGQLPALLANSTAQLYQSPKWFVDYQAHKYLQFLEG